MQHQMKLNKLLEKKHWRPIQIRVETLKNLKKQMKQTKSYLTQTKGLHMMKNMMNTIIASEQKQEVVEAVTIIQEGTDMAVAVIQEGTEIAIEVAKKKQVVVFREIMKNTFIQVHLKMEEALEEQRKSVKEANHAKAVARLVANSPEKIDFCGPPLEGPQKPTNDLHTLL